MNYDYLVVTSAASPYHSVEPFVIVVEAPLVEVDETNAKGPYAENVVSDRDVARSLISAMPHCERIASGDDPHSKKCFLVRGIETQRLIDKLWGCGQSVLFISVDLEILAFYRAFVEAALWATTNEDATDEEGNKTDACFDRDFDIDDLTPELHKEWWEECHAFLALTYGRITDENYCGSAQYNCVDMAGHDFFLTRNGHGSGFWDGDWEEHQELCDVSRAFGDTNIYENDGQVDKG